MAAVPSFRRAETPLSTNALASPKSRTFALPSFVSMMFAGLQVPVRDAALIECARALISELREDGDRDVHGPPRAIGPPCEDLGWTMSRSLDELHRR